MLVQILLKHLLIMDTEKKCVLLVKEELLEPNFSFKDRQKSCILDTPKGSQPNLMAGN